MIQDKTVKGYRAFTVEAGKPYPLNIKGAGWYRLRTVAGSGLTMRVNESGVFFPAEAGENDTGLIHRLDFQNNTAGDIDVQVLWGNGTAPKPEKTNLENAEFYLLAAQIADLKNVDLPPSVVADLKNVTASPAAVAKTVEINAVQDGTSATYTDSKEVTVMNVGTVALTVNGKEIKGGHVKTWIAHESGQLLHDITVDATPTGAVAHVIGVK